MMRLFSPAKLNLFFRVLSKREDGYHEIASLFQTVGLADFLSLEKADRDQLTSNWADLPCDRSNLVMKAIDLFRKKTGIDVSIKVHLEKQIPMESGLGGGSSNAATALWGINELCGNPVEVAKLQHWSQEIGSDVPFFFSLGTAYCRGRGEIIKEMPSLEESSCWITKPKKALSTALVYQHATPSESGDSDLEPILKSFYEGKRAYFNDLERPAFKLIPSLELFKKKLQRAGFESVSMTGSGTAFFCLGNRPPSSLSETLFLRAPFINRNAQSWYEFR